VLGMTRPLTMLVLLVVLLPLVAAGQGRRRGGPAAVTVPYDSHFVFTRIRYGAGGGLARGFFGGGGWEHDYPTADRNLAAILDYITNMRVRMDGSNIMEPSIAAANCRCSAGAHGAVFASHSGETARPTLRRCAIAANSARIAATAAWRFASVGARTSSENTALPGITFIAPGSASKADST